MCKQCVDLTADYVLQQNVSFPNRGSVGFPTEGFEPIGRDTDPGTAHKQGPAFSGSFDGAGYTINNFSIERPREDYIGFFGYVGIVGQNSEVKNFIIRHVGIRGYEVVGENAGRVIGYAANGSVRGVNNVGGLVGINDGITQGYIRGFPVNRSSGGDRNFGLLVG